MPVTRPGRYKTTTCWPCTKGRFLCRLLTVLCRSTGGKARLTEGCSFRSKQH
ncbi:40S ribosomal protein S27 [Myotis brandtii]|uniref:40S ribosomal protein S27 n=1 Tax=Myotis brandtii TaxID=109478 RepID=S7PPZ7_MYOBR|nr:40S ribosomal protein S27 [Myotis brandtii]